MSATTAVTKTNPFDLYRKVGRKKATQEIRQALEQAADIVAPVLKKYGVLGAVDGESIEAVIEAFFEELHEKL